MKIAEYQLLDIVEYNARSRRLEEAGQLAPPRLLKEESNTYRSPYYFWAYVHHEDDEPAPANLIRTQLTVISDEGNGRRRVKVRIPLQDPRRANGTVIPEGYILVCECRHLGKLV